jgi:hypothetical protein
MMQGTHDWYETLTETYNKLGYITSHADPCVRYKKEKGGYTLTDTYTDNIFGVLKTDREAEERKDEMGKKWEIKDVGENEYFLDESSKTSLVERYNLLNNPTGNMYSTDLTLRTSLLAIPCFW